MKTESMIQSTVIMEKILTPMRPEKFLKEYWRPNKQLIIHGDVERFYELPGLENVQSLEKVLKLYKGPVMAVGDAVTEETCGIADRFLISPEEAMEWYEKGAALEFDHADMFLTDIRKWMDLFRQGLKLPKGTGVKAIVYAAKNGGGFKAHFDAYVNFIFHLKGKKTWKLLQNENCKLPVQHYDLTEAPYLPEELATYWSKEHPDLDLPGADIVDLNPGSFLYLPRGVWHSTSSNEESLSLNITFTQPFWLELLIAEIRNRLVRYDSWRELACDIDLLDPEEQGQVRDKLNTQLKLAVQDLSSIKAEDVLKRHGEEFDIYQITQAVFRQLLAIKNM